MTIIQTPYGNLYPAKDTPIPINLSVAEIKDLSKRKGGYSKTIIIAGYKEANLIFSHYYDVNMADGTFNHKEKMPVVLFQDGIEIIRGYLRLLKMNIQANNTLTSEQYIEYEVGITDVTTTFFQDLGDKLLTDLDLSWMDHERTTSLVVDSFENDYTQGYKYVLPWSEDDQYILSEFNPAIFVREYFDKIFSSNGYSYTWAAMDSGGYNFSKLLMPYTGKEVKAFVDAEYTAKVNGAGFDFSKTPSVVGGIASIDPDTDVSTLELDVVETDPSSSYNVTTFEYTLPVQQQPQSFIVEYSIDYRLFLDNYSGLNTFLFDYNSVPTGEPSLMYAVSFALYRNGVVVTTTSGAFTIQNTVSGTPIIVNVGATAPTGDTLLGEENISGQFLLNGIEYNIGDEFAVRAKVTASYVTSAALKPKWLNMASPFQPVSIDTLLVIDNATITFKPTPDSYGNEQLMRIKDYVDPKIKQRDFIKGIFNMFNLYAEVDTDNTNNIVIKGRDEYYDSGLAYDWTKKLNLLQTQNLTFPSAELTKKYLLKYALGKDSVNTGYLANTGKEYGELVYNFYDQFLQGETRLELPWEPSPLVKTDFNAFVHSFVGLNPSTGLRIVYDEPTLKTCGYYKIFDSATNSVTLNQYAYSGHFDNPIIPSFDLNFGVCDYYLYGNALSKTNNNLYNLHWSRTLEQLENARILEAYFNLDSDDINKIRLNDRVYVKGAWWNILEIKDYNANAYVATKVKLITVDQNQNLDEFQIQKNLQPGINSPEYTGVVGPSVGGINTVVASVSAGDGRIFGPIKQLTDQRVVAMNNVQTQGTVTVVGKNNNIDKSVKNSAIYGNNNQVQGPKNLVFGDNNNVSGSGNLVFGEGLTVDGDNKFVFGSNTIGDITANEVAANDVVIENEIRNPTKVDVTSGSSLKLTGTPGIPTNPDGSSIYITPGEAVVGGSNGNVLLGIDESGAFKGNVGINEDSPTSLLHITRDPTVTNEPTMYISDVTNSPTTVTDPLLQISSVTGGIQFHRNLEVNNFTLSPGGDAAIGVIGKAFYIGNRALLGPGVESSWLRFGDPQAATLADRKTSLMVNLAPLDIGATNDIEIQSGNSINLSSQDINISTNLSSSTGIALSSRSDIYLNPGIFSGAGDLYISNSGVLPDVITSGTNNEFLIIDTDPGAVRGKVKRMHSADVRSFIGAKSFVINHTNDKDKYLVHACIEGPENTVFYRGESKLENGFAEIILPDYFESLTHIENRTVQLTSKITNFEDYISNLASSEIIDGKFKVKCNPNENLSQSFYWEVKAVRKDIPKLEVEPSKNDYELKGDGPYTYLVKK